MYFHPAVRDAKRAELAEGLAEALAGPFGAQMRHLLDRELVRRAAWRWGVQLRGFTLHPVGVPLLMPGPAAMQQPWFLRAGRAAHSARASPTITNRCAHLLPHTQAEFDKSFRLGLAEGRGDFSACARTCALDAAARFTAGLQDALVPGLPTLDGAHDGARQAHSLSRQPAAWQ